MGLADRITIKIFGDDAEYKKTLQGLSGAASTAIGGMVKATAVLKTAWLAVQGVVVGVYSSFNDSMNQVAATMQATDEDLALLTAAAKEAGAATRYSASEAASALNYLALAGFNASDAVSSLPTVLRLAQAGGVDLAYASDMLTDSMSALGLTIEDMSGFADQMARASQKSNTSVGQLGEAILTIGGTAKNLAGGTVELNTALGVLANRGIKGAEGGTHLRNMILSLQNPTKDAEALLKSLGVTVYDAEGNMRSLDAIFGDMNAAMESLTAAERDAIVSGIFNKADLSSVQAMLAGVSDEWGDLMTEIMNSDGAAAAMADTMEEGIGGAMRTLSSASEGFSIALGEKLAPAFTETVNQATAFVRDITQALESGGIDGLVETITGKIPALVDRIVEVAKSALAAVGQWLPSGIKQLVSTLPSLIGGLGEIIPNLISTIMNGIGTLIANLITQLPAIVPRLIEAVVNIAKSIVTGSISALGNIFNTINQMIFPPDNIQTRVKAYVDNVFAGADLDNVEHLKKDIQVDYTPTVSGGEAWKTELETKLSGISEYLKGISGLTEADEQAIYDAILSASGADALAAALADMGYPKETVQAIVTEYTTSGLADDIGRINATMTQLGVPENDQKKILDAMLQATGVQDFYDAMIQLGVPIDKAKAIAGRYAANFSDGAISLETIATNIIDALTNGIPDDEDVDLTQARADWDAYFQGLRDELDLWYAQEVADLSASGLSGAEFDTAMADLIAQYTDVSTTLTTANDAGIAWFETYAGQPGAVVKAASEELFAELGLAQYAASMIESWTDEAANGREQRNRRVVEQGLTNNADDIYRAMAFTGAERDNAITTARENRAAAYDALLEENLTPAEFEARVAELDAEMATAIQAAYATFDEHMLAIIQGQGGMNEITASIIENMSGWDEGLAAAFGSIVNGTIDLSDYMDEAGNIDVSGLFGDVDQAALEAAAQAEGFDSVDAFMQALNTALELKMQSDSGLFTESTADTEHAMSVVEGYFNSFTDAMNDAVTASTDDLDIEANTGLAEALIAMEEEGALTLGDASTTAAELYTNALQMPVDAAKTELTDGVSDITEAAAGFNDAMGNVALGGMDSLDGDGAGEAIGEYTSTIVNGVNSAAEQVDTASDGIVSNADVSSEMASVGANIGRGFDRGLKAQMRIAIANAKSIIRSMPADWRNILGIRSPSRVMKAIGEYTGQGFGIGLTESLSAAVKTAENITAGMVESMGISSAYGFSGLTGALNGTTAAFRQVSERPIIMTMDGRKVAQINSSNARTANNARSRAIALGVGSK